MIYVVSACIDGATPRRLGSYFTKGVVVSGRFAALPDLYDQSKRLIMFRRFILLIGWKLMIFMSMLNVWISYVLKPINGYPYLCDCALSHCKYQSKICEHYDGAVAQQYLIICKKFIMCKVTYKVHVHWQGKTFHSITLLLGYAPVPCTKTVRFYC